MIREKRKHKKRIKVILAVILVIAALFLIGFVCIWTLFTVKKVTVEGNERYDDGVIRDAVLNDEYSWNSLFVYFKYKFNEPETIPFIDTMEISLKSRNEIKITVYEKGIVGYVNVESTGQKAYFDKDGIVVEVSTELIDHAMKINGMDFEEVVLYEKLPVEDKSIFKSLLNLSHSLEKYELVPLTIRVKKNGDFLLNYGKTKVLFGSCDALNEKVARLDKIMPSIEGMKGTLHMEDWTDNLSDITFEKGQ